MPALPRPAAAAVHAPARTVMEDLEVRQFLANIVSFTPAIFLDNKKVLNISGGRHNDRIVVSLDSRNKSLMAISINRAVTIVSVNDYASFLIQGNRGDDTIIVDDTYGFVPKPRTLAGGVGNDTITGGALIDSVLGGAGDDLIFGRKGDDSINAEAGDDTVYCGLGNDSVQAGDGNDVIYGEAGDDTINAEAGNDLIIGDIGDDSLIGGPGDDQIYGNAGDDTLFGNEGIDLLVDGPGKDLLQAP